ncbi:L,D-transpeptidase [Antrihabitans cavernicola]|uniref:L,D-transpeptidase family protein n=1 Tax=Antrihabitans cavernicola TaxID=2495913 RepID=A0A5A7SC71_9NOCA|nr:Ig-like domain-containing protein [Spelaeibacter cavernicola]KAA0023728.1 L,D-transpeptidase family protein [Spelaeibacter cavernicola]
MVRRVHPRGFVAFACLVLMLSIGGCTVGTGKDASSGAKASPTSSAPPKSTAEITLTPGSDKPINVTDPVSASVTSGTFTKVTLTNPEGVEVKSVTTPDDLSWKITEPLGYDKTYKLHAEAVDAKGIATSKDADVTTVAPSNQTQLYMEDASGNSLQDGATYGVGVIPVAHFDEPITDRAKAEKAITITTDPPVQGAWHWFSDNSAHWRPENYYAPGTKVSISAKLYGVDLGGGLFGQSDVDTSFDIGDSHISTADDNTKQVTVTNNGAVERTMPTSMGQGGTETVNGQTISFWTPSGTYTVMGKENPVIMDSSTYGLPINSRLGYKESINWATRISGDGIYLHQLDSTVWAQGNTDTSHGCLNLNEDNAQWFYNFSRIGDVVQVINTGGPPQDVGNNGDWAMSWADWQARG